MSTNTTTNNIRYFIFSRTQLNLQKEVARKLGKNFASNKVYSNGQALEFTEIIKDPNNSRYADAKVVASGDIKKMKYVLNN